MSTRCSNTPEGVDRAFKKLDTIKKDVVWWEAGAQPPQLLADGQVVMTSAWNGRIFDAVKKSGKPFRDRVGRAGPRLGLVGDPEGRPAAATTPISSSPSPAQPAAQADQTNYISYGPAQQDAIPQVDAGDPAESADGA